MKKLLVLIFSVCFLSLDAQIGDLFISEYGEGSGYNKYIEIYNGTGSTVDLSDYQIWKTTNGSNWPGLILDLAGALVNDETYIVCSSDQSVNSIILNVADTLWSSANWNGNDAVGLAKNGMLIDVVGQDGIPPATAWEVAGIIDATKEHTLVRKCTVTDGDTNWVGSAGLDSLTSQWIVYPQDYWQDINSHNLCLSTSAFITGTNTICEGESAIVKIDFIGTPPFTFVFSINGVSQPTVTTSVNPYIINIQPSLAGTHNYILDSYYDALGIGTVSGAAYVTVSPLPNIFISPSNVGCFGGFDGAIVATATGGTPPFQYSLGAALSQSSGNFMNLVAGTYYVDVTDINGCTSNGTVTITEPLLIESFDSLITNTAFIWNGLTLNTSGDYSDTIINAAGCDSIVHLNLVITNPSGVVNLSNKRRIVSITDILAKESPYRRNTFLLYLYDDGTVEKKIVVE